MSQPAAAHRPADANPPEGRRAQFKRLARAAHGWVFWLPAIVALAVVQVLWCGYQLGVGNQSIQIAFLETLHNPALFVRDVMVTSTLEDYPSYFYRLLAMLRAEVGVPGLYAAGHLIATAAVLATMVLLCRSLFRDRWSGLAVMLLLLAGHHAVLGGDGLYSTGFTHTWASLPIGLLALALFYRGWRFAAFALVGLLMNLHALEAGYLALFFGFWSLWHLRSLGWKRWLALIAVLIVCASPTLVMMATHRPSYGPDWLQLMHIRSADHSFPSTWWQVGDAGVPRMLMLVALAAVAMSLSPRGEHRRITALFALAAALICAAGYVLTEIWPLPLAVRAQLFRCTRFVALVALAYIARGLVVAVGLAGDSAAATPGGRWSWWRRSLEAAAAGVTFAAVALPSMITLLPIAVAVTTLVAWINRRLSWPAAAIAGASLLVALVAWRTIDLVVPGLSPQVTWRSLLDLQPPSVVALALLAAGLIWWVLGNARLPRGMAAALALIGLLGAWPVARAAYGHMRDRVGSDGAWVDVQRWAQQHTPTDALLLTPAHPGGFRVHAQRSIVGEWRDGTQLYFSADFAEPWWSRMHDLQPGMVLDKAGLKLAWPGRSLSQLEDRTIIDLAKRYDAGYAVLPASEQRRLVTLYDNGSWAVYKPELVPPPPVETDPAAADQRFYEQTVLPNIDRHRKSDARLQVLDADGRPLHDAAYRIVQTNSAFGFGCSLDFFRRPDFERDRDFVPGQVVPEQLERFTELFNYTMIPFSGKWLYLESTEGQRRYEDLDAYLAWCENNGVRVEYHFLSGYRPPWLRDKPAKEQARLFLEHAKDLVGRYADQVEAWQIVNEKIGIKASPAVFEAVRELDPDAKLAISDCARFYSPHESPRRERDLTRGLREVRWLQEQGVELDYFAFHGHRPFGLWADSRVVYEAIDAFADAGVKVRITEFGQPLGDAFEGDVRDGQWTPQAQADYYVRMYTLAYSHPAVEAINLFGLGHNTWMRGSGLFNEDNQPTPAFHALKELISETFRTRVEGQLALDGAAEFRGFHGEYRLELTLPGGETVTTTFRLTPEADNDLRLQLDPSGKTLGRQEGAGG
jgi:GH35 family endo-1,4-beta-xylanase